MDEKPPTTPGRGWMRAKEIRPLFQVTAAAWRKDWRPYVNDEHIQEIGRETWYFVRGVFDDMLAYRVESTIRRRGLAKRDGPGRPRNEANDELTRLKVAKEQRRLIPREDVHRGFGRMADVLRTAGDTLGKHYGAEAQDVLIEAMDNLADVVRQDFVGGGGVNGTKNGKGG